MLDELCPLLDSGKAKDLLARLEHRKDVDQVLPAEIELGFLWALSRAFAIEVEPDWWTNEYRPDAFVREFLPGINAAIEIAAPSDDSISGEAAMDRIAQQVCKLAKGVGPYLYFTFDSTSGYRDGRYFRHVLAPERYVLSESARQVVSSWLSAGTETPLRIEEDGLRMTVTRKPYKQVRFNNIWSSMPPETHSHEGNPLFELLDRKRRQVAAAPANALRLLLIGDTGSRLINQIGSVGELDPTRRQVSGREIIQHFARKHADRVDAVIIIAPHRRREMLSREHLFWQVSVFSGHATPPAIAPALEKMLANLPRPRFEGYQTRSLYRQGLCSPQSRGWYLGLEFRGKIGGTMTAKVSARGLLDLLAGRISEQQFRYMVTEGSDGHNVFRHFLDQGRTITHVEMAPRGLDEDDDHLILHFSDDAAARTLRLNATTAERTDE